MFGSRWNSPFGLFHDMEAEFRRVEQQMDDLMARAGTRPLVYGWSMRMGPDGRPQVREFGNTGQQPAQIAEGWREPFASTVLDEEHNTLHATFELPGVNKKDINVEVSADAVTVQAETGEHRYKARVPVEVTLDPDGADARFKNGILDLSIRLADAGSKGKKVNVK